MRWLMKSAIGILVGLMLVSSSGVAEVPRTKPEDVEISSERLGRITDLMQRQIDAGNFSGSVTLVARNGRIAHLKALGLMDIETHGSRCRRMRFSGSCQ